MAASRTIEPLPGSQPILAADGAEPGRAYPDGVAGQRPYWLWLTLSVSAFCVLLFTGFDYLLPGPPPPVWTPAFIAITQSASLFLCFTIYWAVRLTERLPERWSWAALFVVAMTAALLCSSVAYGSVLWFQRNNPVFEPHYLAGIAGSMVIDIWMFGFFTVAQKLLRTLELERQRDARLTEARIAAGEAQVLALRYQVSPHFLFNTLNAISGLITTGRGDEATDMMARLSDYLRSSTQGESRAAIPLAEELAAVEAYLAIERVRFGRRLAFVIDCPEDALACEVPIFLLQPLVENAVKHAVAPSSGQVTITLRVTAQPNRLIIVVEDDGRARKQVVGLGIGLRNVARRIELIHGAAGRLETELREVGFTARLALPLKIALARTPANDGTMPDAAPTVSAAASL